MKKATIIVYQEDPYNSMFDVLFEDLRDDADVFFVMEKALPEHGFYRYLPSKKLKSITFGLSNRLYLHYYNLPKEIKKLKRKYDHISVLLHNASLIKPQYPVEMFPALKKMASFNLLYVDAHDHVTVSGHANYLLRHDVFDRVFTIDPVDAKKYNLEFCFTPYSKLSFTGSSLPQKQMYFCGGNAGRMYMLYSIWKSAKEKKIKAVYDLAHSKLFADFFEGDPNVHLVEHLPYREVLKNVCASSCILDITKKGQAALTLRPYEAVVYNKKLLTNNKNIVQFKYYDERFMKYFEKIEDIDWDWIREDCTIDYGYQDDFSPKLLLEKMK